MPSLDLCPLPSSRQHKSEPPLISRDRQYTETPSLVIALVPSLPPSSRQVDAASTSLSCRHRAATRQVCSPVESPSCRPASKCPRHHDVVVDFVKRTSPSLDLHDIVNSPRLLPRSHRPSLPLNCAISPLPVLLDNTPVAYSLTNASFSLDETTPTSLFLPLQSRSTTLLLLSISSNLPNPMTGTDKPCLHGLLASPSRSHLLTMAHTDGTPSTSPLPSPSSGSPHGLHHPLGCVFLASPNSHNPRARLPLRYNLPNACNPSSFPIHQKPSPPSRSTPPLTPTATPTSLPISSFSLAASPTPMAYHRVPPLLHPLFRFQNLTLMIP